MPGAFKFLVLADESPEFAAAALYAGLRAAKTGSKLLMLRVIEPPDGAYWSTVEHQMRQESLEGAQSLTARYAAELWAECGVEAEILIREGEQRAELRRLIEEDQDIKALLLAAGAGRDGPGPLVASIAKGQNIGGRALPIVVVPGGLSKSEIRALAGADGVT